METSPTTTCWTTPNLKQPATPNPHGCSSCPGRPGQINTSAALGSWCAAIGEMVKVVGVLILYKFVPFHPFKNIPTWAAGSENTYVMPAIFISDEADECVNPNETFKLVLLEEHGEHLGYNPAHRV